MSHVSVNTKRAAAAAGGLLAYAAFVEPFAVQLERITIRCERLPRAFDGYKVVLLSDFHSRKIGLRERRVLDIVGRTRDVDLIALCGDLIYTPRGMDQMIDLVRSLQARDGVCATFGNSEHKNGVVPHRFAERLAEAGAAMLLNRNVRLTCGGESIVVAGVDDPVSGHDDIAEALAGVSESDFKLVLMYTPDSIALAAARGVDVVLSGHTHGGQVKLPIVGAAFTHSYLGSAMSHGLYAGRRLQQVVGFRTGRTQLYVSRGIGVSGLAIRFLCRPEVTLITLKCALP